jgi:hypothetical protein
MELHKHANCAITHAFPAHRLHRRHVHLVMKALIEHLLDHHVNVMQGSEMMAFMPHVLVNIIGHVVCDLSC